MSKRCALSSSYALIIILGTFLVPVAFGVLPPPPFLLLFGGVAAEFASHARPGDRQQPPEISNQIMTLKVSSFRANLQYFLYVTPFSDWHRFRFSSAQHLPVSSDRAIEHLVVKHEICPQ